MELAVARPGAQDLLTRLALFPDGVAVAAVEAVAPVGRRDDALDDLAELVEQSLVQLVETEGQPVRYRLLETVREFGAARLRERGTTAEVRAAMTDWGRELARTRNLFTLFGPGQLAAFDDVRRESDTLVTLLRWALRDDDVPTVAHVFAALGGYWTLRGAHGEVVAIAPDVVDALRSRAPDAADRAATVAGLVVCGASAAFTDRRTTAWAVSTLRRLRRSGATGYPPLDAQWAMLLTLGRPADGAALLGRLRTDPDPDVAGMANMISAPLAENGGEPAAALAFAARAQELSVLTGDAWTTGSGAVTTTQLSAQNGRYAEALAAAETARVQLERFGADDDLWRSAGRWASPQPPPATPSAHERSPLTSVTVRRPRAARSTTTGPRSTSSLRRSPPSAPGPRATSTGPSPPTGPHGTSRCARGGGRRTGPRWRGPR